MAPVVVAFLEQVRAATYAAAAGGRPHLPVTLVLDEVANVAPLPDLPAMVSEGGGQGLLTLACLQNLSQARSRWGRAAEGFFSLFGTKVLLGGIGDIPTAEAVSRLAGQMDVAVRSVTRSAWWSGRPQASTTFSWRRQPRLPVDKAHSLPPGSALVVSGAHPPGLAYLTPWWGYPPFDDARHARLAPSPPLPHPGPAPRVPLPPSPPAGWAGDPGRHFRHLAQSPRAAAAAPSPAPGMSVLLTIPAQGLAPQPTRRANGPANARSRPAPVAGRIATYLTPTRRNGPLRLGTPPSMAGWRRPGGGLVKEGAAGLGGAAAGRGPCRGGRRWAACR